jgi:hypothetical protein
MASITVTRPPTRVARTAERPNKNVFTLHSNVNSVFAWRTSNENMKTATVVFRRQQDALLMAHMIERHVRQNKEWPSPSMFDFQLDNGPVRAELDLIEIREWDMDSLKVFCVESYLDMVTLSRLTPSNDGFRINGELISLDVPFGFYTERLAYLYDLN